MTKELENILKDKTLTKKQKIQIINQYYDNYRAEIDKNLNNYLAKQYIGAALEIGAATLPVRGAGKLGGEIGKQLKNYGNIDNLDEILRKQYSNDSKKFYITKSIPDSTSHATSTASTGNLRTYLESPNNIIPSVNSNYNTQVGNNVLHGKVEMNVDNGQKSDLFGYTNPLTGSNHIYTREEVGSMTSDEFAKHEKEIDAQTKAFNGTMPTNGDLQREAIKLRLALNGNASN